MKISVKVYWVYCKFTPKLSNLTDRCWINYVKNGVNWDFLGKDFELTFVRSEVVGAAVNPGNCVGRGPLPREGREGLKRGRQHEDRDPETHSRVDLPSLRFRLGRKNDEWCSHEARGHENKLKKQKQPFTLIQYLWQY